MTVITNLRRVNLYVELTEHTDDGNLRRFKRTLNHVDHEIPATVTKAMMVALFKLQSFDVGGFGEFHEYSFHG